MAGIEEAKYKDWILDTIDQLRKRKARPDLERICHMVERKHGLSFEQIEADLDKLVDAGIVFKVDYKGSTSYRNAAKWKKGPLAGSILNSNDVSRRILDAVRTLADSVDGTGSSSEEDGSPREQSGVSFSEIENWMEEEEPEMNLVENTLEDALQREVDAGCLKKLSNGNFVLVSEELAVKPLKFKLSKTPSKGRGSAKSERRGGSDGAAGATENSSGKGTDAHSTKNNSSPGKKSKHGTKRKKLRKVLDPDFELDSPPAKHRKETSEGHRLGRREGSEGHRPGRKESSEGYRQGRKDSVEGHRLGRKDSAEGHRQIRKEGGADSKSKGDKRGRASPSRSKASALSRPIMDDEPRCDFCLNTAEKNRNGEPESLLICRDCQAKAHPSCMDYSEELAERARNSPWQCIDCKTCFICEDAGDPDAMLFCDSCDKGYHMTCHKPPIDEKPTGNWVCSECVEERDSEMKDDQSEDRKPQQNGVKEEEEEDDDETEDDERSQEGTESTESEQRAKQERLFNGDGGASCLPTPSASPVYFKEEPPEPADRKSKFSQRVMAPLPKLADTMTAEVPDASEWTIEDVVAFFKGVGFIEHSEVFREQEIDGKSLLLMKRSDVLQGLSLRLGPALKIYAHVQRLQTKGQIVL